MSTAYWNLWQITIFYSIVSKFNTVMQYKAIPSHTACQTQYSLRANCTDFIANDEWPPNSPQLTWLSCVRCNASGISQTSLKAKDYSGAKTCTAADLGWLAADNDQESNNNFRKRLNARASAGRGHFEQTMWTLYRTILTELCFRNYNKLSVLTRRLSSNSKSSCLWKVKIHWVVALIMA